jgi:hypothetical protein
LAPLLVFALTYSTSSRYLAVSWSLGEQIRALAGRTEPAGQSSCSADRHAEVVSITAQDAWAYDTSTGISLEVTSLPSLLRLRVLAFVHTAGEE